MDEAGNVTDILAAKIGELCELEPFEHPKCRKCPLPSKNV